MLLGVILELGCPYISIKWKNVQMHSSTFLFSCSTEEVRKDMMMTLHFWVNNSLKIEIQGKKC